MAQRTVGGDVADNAVDTGEPVKVGGKVNTSAQVYADGDRADAQSDTAGHWKTVSRTYTAALSADEGANDSDKTITVATGEEWEIQSIRVELVTTGNAGDRQMTVQVRDGSDDIVFEVTAGLVQAANLTYNYHFAPDVVNITSVLDTSHVSTPFPKLVLPAGYDLRIFDNNAVDAAADDMVIQLLYRSRDVV